MSKSNKFFFIIFIVIILEFGYFLKMNSRMDYIINSTKQEWSYHDDKQSSIIDELNDLYDQMNGILEEDESKQWIQDFSYTFLNLNEDYTKVNTEFNVSFKELYNGSEIYIIATNVEDENDFEEIHLEEITDLSYGVTIELDNNKDYSIDIVSESNFMRQREHLRRIYFTDIFDSEKRNTIGGYGRTSDWIHFTIVNRHYDLEEFKLTKIYLRAYDQSTLIEEIDITDLVEVGHYPHTPNENNSYSYDYTVPSDKYKLTKLQIIVEDQFGTYTIEENFDF